MYDIATIYTDKQGKYGLQNRLSGEMVFWMRKWFFGREDGILLGEIGFLFGKMDIVSVRMGISTEEMVVSPRK
jgi:hypothetical protein